MPRLHADPDALRAIHGSTAEQLDALRCGLGSLVVAADELGASWRDSNYLTWREELDGVAARVSARLDELAVLNDRLARLVVTIEDLGAPGAAAVRAMPFDAGLSTPTSHGDRVILPGGVLPALERSGLIDWVDEDFAATFMTATYHNHSGTNYMALARRWAGDLQGRPDPDARRLYLTTRTDRIRAELRVDGQLSFYDGRHRAMAALRLKAPVPIELLLPCQRPDGSVEYINAARADFPIARCLAALAGAPIPVRQLVESLRESIFATDAYAVIASQHRMSRSRSSSSSSS